MELDMIMNTAAESEAAGNYADVDYNIRLPEAEFEVMQAVWEGEAPMTTGYLMKAIGYSKGWKAPTLISFLVRLENRGFITSCKNGKERLYTPVADRTTYLSRVTEDFVEKYHSGSFVNLLDSLFCDRNFSNDEVDALLAWLKVKYH